MTARISIITPSYQQATYLKECLDSVHEQHYGLLEHIVVDGGSEDGSKEIIEQYDERLAWWCSTHDRGQSHAINKGLTHATGSVFGWLNSDDLLLPGSLELVGGAFGTDPDLLAFGGHRIFRGNDGTATRSALDDINDREALFISPKVNQQSTFYRMDAVRAVDGVDEDLHHAMDLELWWQMLFKYGTDHLRCVNKDLAVFRLHDESKTGKGSLAFRTETARILRSMADQLGMTELVDVLTIGYPTGAAGRSMSLEQTHRGIVKRMVVHFLLKWHHVIHEREDYAMMRAFLRTVDLDRSQLDQDQRIKVAALDEQLDVPNWLAFRIKRKLQHGWV